jgi:hypothetical protein
MKRYYVRPCDEMGSIVDAMVSGKDRTWDVIDRERGVAISNHRRRSDARTEAAERNAESTEAKS